MIIRSFFLGAAMLICASAFAQDLTMKGVVKDQTGQPVSGAVVYVPGTSIGTTTNDAGEFALNVKAHTDVVISFLGYEPQTIKVGETVSFQEVVLADSQQLNEAVVTALGVAREKKTLGYAIQEVKGEELLSANETNITNALTGKVAGLQIIRSANGPGASSKIILRGNNSLTGLNQPLIVVDGVPMDNFIGASNNDFWNPSADMGNGLQDINPEDVESMTVLKGASAAALYGSRAGNGVILITTKKGRENSGLGLTISGSVALTTPFSKPDMQTQYGQGSLGTSDPQSDLSWGGTANEVYDNVDGFFKTGVNDQQNVTFSQKYGNTGLFASYTRMNDNSIIPYAGLKRNNFMLRGTSQFGKNNRWSFDGKVQYIRTIANNRPISGSNATNSFLQMYTLPIDVDVTKYSSGVDVNGQETFYKQGVSNPYWTAQYRKNNDKRDRFLMYAALKYQFTDWLDAELKAGTDMYNTETENKTYAGSFNLNNSYSLGESRFFENNFSFLVTAKKEKVIGEWGGVVSVGGNLMERENRGVSSSASKLNIPNLFDLNNVTDHGNVSTSESYSHRKMNSLYGTLQINYGGFVYLDATWRNDWTSTLSKAHRSYFYPSVSLSWVISDMINKYSTMPDWFTYAKLRASYAQVGNDMDPYQLYNEYSVSTLQNGTPQTGMSSSTLYNANVVNELIKSTEVGFDVRFFDNRLGFDFTWYKSNATNQLINLPMNSLSGYNNKKVNAGNIQNSGVELVINAVPVRIKDFEWNFDINFSANQNKIIELADGVKEYGLGTYDNFKIVATAGGLYGEMYGTKFKRVEDEKSPYNGQLILNSDGLPQSGGTGYLGSQNPVCQLGWTNNFRWKDLTFSFQIDGRVGGKMFSGTLMTMQYYGTAAETAANGRNDFVVEGVVDDGNGGYTKNTTKTTAQKYWQTISGKAGGNLGITEANLYDATNFRVRNIAISYSLPKNLLRKSNVFQTVKFGAAVTNAFMIYSNMKGLDPESVYATSTNATGFEYGSNPTSRCWTFNVTLGF